MLLTVAVCGVATVLFYSVLLFTGSLSGNDWSSHHFHYFDWVRRSLVDHQTLPLYMATAWITPNFLANAEAPQLSPLVVLMPLFSTGVYLKLLIVGFATLGSVGMLLLLRDLSVSTPVAVLATVVFVGNGFFPSHLAIGHPWAMGGYLLPALLCLFRRAVLGNRSAWVAAVALNALTILGGQHQPFIWQNLFLATVAGVWCATERSVRPLLVWGGFTLASAGLGAIKLIPLWVEFADYAPTAKTVGLPLASLGFSLLSRGQGVETSVPGLDFSHGSGWWEWAFYVGPVGGLLLVLSIFARGCWPLWIAGGSFAVLAVAWPVGLRALDLWPLLEDLPVWRTQRSPSRFLLLSVFAFSVAGALGAQRFYDWSQRRWPMATLAAFVTAALLAGADAFSQSLTWQREGVGAPIESIDPRPRPLRITGEGGARAELVEFAPNRLVYRAEARQTATLVLPLWHRPDKDEWQIEGASLGSRENRLAVELEPGNRELILVYRPRGVVAGAVISAVSAALGVFCLWRRR
ncbi:hypothetical protein MK489_01440 [Myxococcota bacterium]|nr:hypothetical protein [Myxococcota bacterium]